MTIQMVCSSRNGVLSSEIPHLLMETRKAIEHQKGYMINFRKLFHYNNFVIGNFKEDKIKPIKTKRLQ